MTYFAKKHAMASDETTEPRPFWKKKRWSFLGLLLLLGCGAADVLLGGPQFINSSGTTSVEKNANAEQPCALTTDAQVIDAAISTVVRSGTLFQRSMSAGDCPMSPKPKLTCFNSFPYFSVPQFKAKNPDCCKVLKQIPGEEPMTYRPHIRGEKYPKMYVVQMDFEAFSEGKTGLPSPYTHHDIVTLNCFGERMRDDVP